MTLQLLFWILMLFWLLFGVWNGFTGDQPFRVWGGSLFQFLLFLVLGWKVFGAPIQ